MRWSACLLLLVAGCDEQLPDVAADGAVDGAGGAVVDGGVEGGDDATSDAEPRPDRGLDGAMDAGSADARAAVGAGDLAFAAQAADRIVADAGPLDAAADTNRRDATRPDAARPDAGRPDAGPAGNCAPCEGDGDCAALGEGAVCVALIGDRCSAGCQDNGDCPPHFSCILAQCIPAGARCDSCAVEGCADDERCNDFNGQCEPLGGRCATCADDADCAGALFCRQVGLSRNCVAACDAGACAEGFACTDGACRPESGVCDVCGGCVGERPVCDGIRRMCLACGAGTPCEAPLVCTPEGECEQPEAGVDCLSVLDCRDPAWPYCEEGACIACRDDRFCPAGTSCVEGLCADGDACTGVTCHGEIECAGGVCDGGCQADEDCGDEALRCNAETGQCHREDQRCDPEGLTSVCAPGGVCGADPLNANDTVCSCLREDPGNALEPNQDHRVPCQPGGICLQIGRDPGVCVRAP